MKHRAVKRRSVVLGIGATAGVAAAGGFALSAQASGESSGEPGAKASGASGALAFDKDACTELTTTITDAAGDEHEVKYHFYKAITYVTKPVDEKYQSLNVSVPVEIDGKAVDTTGAPILLANSVGGYMPSSVAEATGVGGGEMTGGPGGGATGGANASAAPGASASPSASGGTGTGLGRGAVRRQRDGGRPGRDGQPRQAGPGDGVRRRGAGRPRPHPRRLGRHVLRHRPGRHRRPEGRGPVRTRQQGPHPRQHRPDRLLRDQRGRRPVRPARRVRRQPALRQVPQGAGRGRRERRRLRQRRLVPDHRPRTRRHGVRVELGRQQAEFGLAGRPDRVQGTEHRVRRLPGVPQAQGEGLR